MFDDFNDDSEDFAPEFDTKAQEQMEILKDRLARANYMAIKKHGIDTQYHSNTDSEMLRQIVRETLEYFEDLEEYEKCADLKKVLDTINY